MWSRPEKRRDGWLSSDAVGDGHKLDDQGRTAANLAASSPLYINAQGEIDLDMDHPTFKALIAKAVAVAKGG